MRRCSLLLSLLIALLLAAPSVGAQDDPLADLGLPELTITLSDAGLEGVPAETAAGQYLVTFTNDVSDSGDPLSDLWSVEFVQLPDGMTIDDLAALFAGPPEGAESDGGTPITEDGGTGAEGSPAAAGDPFAFLYETYLAGGPGAPRGETVHGVIDLTPGDYAVATFGIGAPIAMTVTGADDAAETSEIEATGTITETGTSGSFDFTADGLSEGPGVLAIVNDSDQPHFVIAVRSDEEITEDEMLTLLMEEEGGESGSPAAEPSGPELAPVFITGTQSPDTTQYLAVDLEPGYYVLVCFVGDPAQGGIPHAFEGMIEIVPVGV